jgi:hypothetical protein
VGGLRRWANGKPRTAQALRPTHLPYSVYSADPHGPEKSSMIIPIPNLHECPICQARADQIENHRVSWFCNSCACEFEIKADGRIGRKLPAPHLYATDVSGNVIDGP